MQVVFFSFFFLLLVSLLLEKNLTKYAIFCDLLTVIMKIVSFIFLNNISY